MIKSEIDTYPAEVVLETLWHATKMISDGAITDSLMSTSFKISEKNFNRMVRKESTQPDVEDPEGRTGGRFSHVFEWGSSPANPIPLYKLFMAGRGSRRVAGYTFIQSRKAVPQPDALKPFYRRTHVFREKAAVLENADEIKINPIHGKYMVYWRPESSAANKDGVVFRKNESTIFRAGGGKYDANFAQAFFAWWSGEFGVGGDMAKIARMLDMDKSMKVAKVVSMQKQIATQRRNLASKDATPEAKRKAKAMIADLNSQIKRVNKTL